MKRIFLLLVMMAFLSAGLFADVTVSTDGATDFGEFTGMSKLAAEYEVFDGFTVNGNVKAAYVPVALSWGGGLAFAGEVFTVSADMTGDQDTVVSDVTAYGDITFGAITVYGQTVLNTGADIFGGMEAGIDTAIAGINVVAGYWIGPGSAVNNPYESNADGELFFAASYTF